MKETLEALIKVYECGVCLEIVRPDMVQCENSHLVCADCKFGLTSCPTCRASFSKEKPPKKVIESVETLPSRCKYLGCSVYLKRGSSHEKYCAYADASCKICNWSDVRLELFEHCLENHETHILTANSRRGVIEEFDFREYCLETKVVSFGDQIFWMDLKNNPENQTFLATFVPVPFEEPLKPVFVKLFLGFKGQQFMCRIELNPDPNVDVSVENFISVPWKFLPNLLNTEGELHYNVHF